MIVWAGKSSDDLRVTVERYPSQPRPRRRQEAQSIPGRNGNLLIVEDAYDNVLQPYEVYLSAERDGLPPAARAVAEWICAPKGYQRLEDSYEPDVFRLAYYEGPLDISNILNRFGRATLEFNCKPQRYLKSGERAAALTASGARLSNPGMESRPLITVYGTGAGTLTAGGRTVQLKSLDGWLTLDCDLQNAYKGTQNKNSAIFAPEFPVLPPGESAVTWTGGVTRVEIIPRWWVL